MSVEEPALKALKNGEVASVTSEKNRGALAQANTQWFFGEWAALTKIGPKTLYEHAERDRLALLVAAAHTQLGSYDEAREHLHLALKWGCPPRLVAEVLIAGVHNTLGRATAVAGQQDRAQKHFEQSVMIEALGSEGRLVSQARAGNQLAQLGLSADISSQERDQAKPKAASPSTSAKTGKSTESLERKNTDVLARLREQSEAADRLPQDIGELVRKEILNATKQLEAFIEVRDHLGTDELIGDMHGWPISPDLALYLVQLIETNDYDVVIEFGSGTSTVLIARALAKIASGHHRKSPTVQLAFEHLAEYHAQTLAQLQRARLADSVQLALAPLIPYIAPNGSVYSYYDCERTLGKLGRGRNHSELRILVLVDGPPGSTGKYARYPAVPIVLAHFGKHHVDFLLDDYFRPDEKAIAEMWLEDMRSQGLRCDVTEKRLEKGACLISASVQARA